MSAAVLEAPPGLLAGERAVAAAGGRGTTLEERLEAAWRAALQHGRTECPVCHAAMRADGAAAWCGGCGSVLS